MKASSKSKQLRFENPARYRIRVKGALDEQYSDCLGDLTIAISKGADGVPVTILAGQVRDQCELMGILNNLYELHLPLYSVEFFH